MITVFIWLFFFHFVADFILQSRQMALEKSSRPAMLLLHLSIIFFTFFIGGLYVFPNPVTAYQIAWLNACFHGLIDWNLWKIYKRLTINRVTKHYPEDPEKVQYTLKNWEYWTDKTFYTFIGLDQFLHYITLLLIIDWVL